MKRDLQIHVSGTSFSDLRGHATASGGNALSRNAVLHDEALATFR